MKVEYKNLCALFLAPLLVMLTSCGEHPTTARTEPVAVKPLIDHEHGFRIEHPATWAVEQGDMSNLKGVYGLNLLQHYKVKDPKKKFDLRVYVLNNPDRKAIGEFLTIKKESKKSAVTYATPRTVYENTAIPYVEVGYSYDPPLWGLIQAEIESMHALSPDKFVYMQLAVAANVSMYEDVSKALITSFSPTNSEQELQVEGVSK